MVVQLFNRITITPFIPSRLWAAVVCFGDNMVIPFIPSRLWAAVACFGFTICSSISFHPFPPMGCGGLFRLCTKDHSFLPAYGLRWFVLELEITPFIPSRLWAAVVCFGEYAHNDCRLASQGILPFKGICVGGLYFAIQYK